MIGHKQQETDISQKQQGISMNIDKNKQQEVIRELEPFLEKQLGIYQKDIKDYWQPADYLPDFSRGDWQDQVQQVKAETKELPDSLITVLVGDMITEEALPNYQTWFNRLDFVKDPTGVSDNPWARWIRGWTAEEKRHGDLLAGYLNLTGRVDMKAVNRSIQSLIKFGFDPQTGPNPYAGLIYTSFQERATKISHRNTGKLSAQYGAKQLQKICAVICADEKRHEEAYQALIAEILKVDADGAVETLADMLKKTIVMPSRRVEDGFGNNLFDDFSATAQAIGVYTASDYSNILEYLIKLWNIELLSGLSSEAAVAQEYICRLPQRYRRLAERYKAKEHRIKLPWIAA